MHLHNLSNVVISARTWFFLSPSKMQYLVTQGSDGLSYAGAKIIPNATYRWVDVRDVANAHCNGKNN